MQTVLNIEGMTCEHCVRAVKQALERVRGVKQAAVSLQTAQAVVDHESIDPRFLIEAVEEEGYQATRS